MPFSTVFYDNSAADKWFYIEIAIDLIFLMDFIINLNTAYYDRNKTLITDRYKIFVQYLKS